MSKKLKVISFETRLLFREWLAKSYKNGNGLCLRLIKKASNKNPSPMTKHLKRTCVFDGSMDKKVLTMNLGSKNLHLEEVRVFGLNEMFQ
ncbi:MAG: hypothetical protein KDD50_10535 [Bdellovibrionales bacterium]|nr:hypothetical protein [Bdellovibrionales bacterium]